MKNKILNNELEDGYYTLICNYSNSSQKKNLNFECLIQITGDLACKYSFYDQLYNTDRIYYLLPLLKEQKVTLNGKTEDKIKDTLCNHFEDLKARENYEFVFIKTFLNTGEYYPQIYRPFLSYDFITKKRKLPSRNNIKHLIGEDFYPSNEKEYLSRLNQLELLTNELSEIFKTVEPTSQNMKCYGHKIRNLIILACTEVDDMCKSILNSNIYIRKTIYTTKDHIKIKDVLKLNEYKIKLRKYPDIEISTPYLHWDHEEPTKSLVWYAAYNSIKHDRINSYNLATLRSAIDSVFAVTVLLIAQYGDKNVFWKDKMEKYFEISEYPNWDYSDLYIPPIWDNDGVEFSKKEYNFDN